MKVLALVALFSLLLLLVYSRIYPYILALKKIFGAAKTLNDSTTNTGAGRKSAAGKSDGKLVRCVGCGTWIPAGRAIENKSGASVFCSRECIEKTANGKERKMAG